MFYLKPPSGLTSLEGLEKICTKRLDFLLQLIGCTSSLQIKDLVEEVSTVEGSDCLIEWTKKDRVSHFLLRMASCNDQEMASTILAGESAFFEFRLTSMTEEELVIFFENTKRELRHINCDGVDKIFSPLIENLNVLKSILCEYDLQDLIKCYFEAEKSDLLLTNFISVPFQFVTDLVAKRQVLLSNGVAMVPCAKLHLVMKSLFCEILKVNLVVARESFHEVKKDARIERIFRKLQAIFGQSNHCSNPRLYAVNPVGFDEVDRLVENFPICMKHLHQNLRERHRLAHHSRIIYTLFLKETGLTVHESIKFWQREYSQAAKDDHPCSHGWQKDGKRYTYNIRHLYGLEGSRTNYRAHTCRALQTMSLSPRDVGGCPFSHFDEKSLQNILDLEDIPETMASNIHSLVRQERWSDACGCVFLSRGLGVLKRCNAAEGEQREDGRSSGNDDQISQCLKETQDFFLSQSNNVKEAYPDVAESDSETEQTAPQKKIKLEYEITQDQNQKLKMQNEVPLPAAKKSTPRILENFPIGLESDQSLPSKIVTPLEVTPTKMTSTKNVDPQPIPSISNCDTTTHEVTANKIGMFTNFKGKPDVDVGVADVTLPNCDIPEDAFEQDPNLKCEFPDFRNLRLGISKPIDYFIAYTNLVEKLRTIGVNETI